MGLNQQAFPGYVSLYDRVILSDGWERVVSGASEDNAEVEVYGLLDSYRLADCLWVGRGSKYDGGRLGISGSNAVCKHDMRVYANTTPATFVCNGCGMRRPNEGLLKRAPTEEEAAILAELLKEAL